MRDQLEQNILDHPDDEAPRLIYADWLEENGESDRAEFIRVQIALEDQGLSGADRRVLVQREATLLNKYQREWLGGLAPFLLDHEDDMRREKTGQNCDFRFRRGFFEELNIKMLGFHLVSAMIQSPVLRWVRHFAIENPTNQDDYSNRQDLKPAEASQEELPESFSTENLLLLCLHLRNVRSLRIGEDWDAESGWTDNWCYWRSVVPTVAKFSQLEELHLLCNTYDPAKLFQLSLPELRVLRMFHLGGHRDPHNGSCAYPLRLLVNNPTIQNLEVLRFHPHYAKEEEYPEPGNYDNYRLLSYLPLEQVQHVLDTPNLPKLKHLQLRLSDMGDAGCKAIVESGILKRLKILDLRHGAITDEGAKILADCPDLKNLERLDVNRNGLTQTGLALLHSTGITVLGDDQQTAEQLEAREYLTEGDFE